MNPTHTIRLADTEHATRRHFLKESLGGLAALMFGVQADHAAASPTARPFDATKPLAPRLGHFAPEAQARHLFAHVWCPQPARAVRAQAGTESCSTARTALKQFLEGKRFAFIRGVPQLLGPVYPFRQVGQAGFWISDRLPHFQKVADKVCFIRSMHSDQFNHAPAELLLHTGNQNLGYASIGSWATYGLGSENQNLPGFVVLVSGGKFPSGGKSLWGSGFLPSVYQGVQCRSHGEPVLFLSNPPGISRELRGDMIETIARINQRTYEEFGDPQTVARIAQYEMAFRMQMAATDAVDISQEPQHIHDLYGTQAGPGEFCQQLSARAAAGRARRAVRAVVRLGLGLARRRGRGSAQQGLSRQVPRYRPGHGRTSG